MPLTDIKIRQSKPSEKAYRIYDMAGLYLVINPSGSKVWRYKFRLDGKEYTYTIGKYPSVSLQAARAELQEAKALVAKGINPTYARAAAKNAQLSENQNTFQAIAEEFLSEKRHQSAAYLKNIKRNFDKYVYPVIGHLPIKSITPAHILAILDKYKRKNIIVSGIQTRQYISGVFMLAIRTLRADSDPTAAFKDYLKRPPIQHAHALNIDELRDFKGRLKNYNGSAVVVSAVWLIFYTAVRTIEARRAEWVDIDLDKAVWHIPAGKMKRRRAHAVPLSRQAVELLRRLHSITGGGRLLFPNMKRPNEMISATTVNRALEYMGVTVSGHDFRATMATHLSEMGFQKIHIDEQLAHAKESLTDAAYFHAQFLKQRAEMLQEWADFIDTLH